jgi:hypothetical protein
MGEGYHMPTDDQEDWRQTPVSMLTEQFEPDPNYFLLLQVIQEKVDPGFFLIYF